MSEIEKFFRENPVDSDVVKDKIIQLGVDFLGGSWKNITRDQVNVSEIVGGQSNYLYHITTSDQSATEFLLRIHRQAPNIVFTETVVFAILSERKLGPKLYGFFEGGRMEEFIPNHLYGKEDSRDPEICRRVASILPRFHSLEIPVSKNHRCFHMMRDWLQGYKDLGGEDYEIFTTTVSYTDHPKMVTVDDLNRELDILEKWAKEVFEDTVVFGHTDVGISNVLELNSTKELMLIDCEFSMYNFRAFDLAMYLSEAAIDYPSEMPGIKIIEEQTENPPNLRAICEAYIDADNQLTSKNGSDRLDQIETLMKEVQFFIPICHLFWAIPSMKHALMKFESEMDLDVQARDRIAVYFCLKPRSQKIYEELVGKK